MTFSEAGPSSFARLKEEEEAIVDELASWSETENNGRWWCFERQAGLKGTGTALPNPEKRNMRVSIGNLAELAGTLMDDRAPARARQKRGSDRSIRVDGFAGWVFVFRPPGESSSVKEKI